MKLVAARIREFKSIWDTTTFTLGDVTCLVGKNEAGKTSVLQALYRLNPLIDGDGTFDVTDDYPRSDVENYQQAIEAKEREQAIVVEATFELDAVEKQQIADLYGPKALESDRITLSRGYERGEHGCTLFIGIRVNEAAVVKHLIEAFQVPEPVKGTASKQTTIKGLADHLASRSKEQAQAFATAQASASAVADAAEKATALEQAKKLAESPEAKALVAKLSEFGEKKLGMHIWRTQLQQSFPKFLYFDEYYQMRGHDNVQALKKRLTEKKLQHSDHPLLGLIELARLDLDKLLGATRTQELKNKLQGASNYLSQQILKYWSQNKHLRMNFDVRPALAEDPEGMRNGTNIWGEVFDSKHLVSTGLGTRSRGFVWFFSFLAWYSAVKKKSEPLIILLDEPGLSLHGKAQEDLLRFFEAEVVPNAKHQLIYTTHSPFMVDSRRFDRVRIVQDKSIDIDDPLPREEDGTKVFVDVLEAGSDTLFPLQGALGYEIYQSLFVGPNSLIVEGVSDLLYLQTMTGILSGAGREGLDSRWTITPVGGSDKVPTFVALLGAQKAMNVTVLVDFQKADKQTIENLYKRKLLTKSNVLTFADFTGTNEADIEDMFDEDLYLQMVNAEYGRELSAKLKAKDLTSKAPRILVRLEDVFKKTPLKSGSFGHYRPARYFAEKSADLTVSATTLDRFEAVFKALNKLL
jgi:predicted ATP-dependent endonuclease of OLD family